MGEVESQKKAKAKKKIKPKAATKNQVEQGDDSPKEPAEQAPVEQAPVEQAPVEQAPVKQAPIKQAPVKQAPVEQTPEEPMEVDSEEPVGNQKQEPDMVSHTESSHQTVESVSTSEATTFRKTSIKKSERKGSVM